MINLRNKDSINSTSKYEDLFNLYYRGLVGFANSYIKNLEESEDIVQDVFTGIWNKNIELNYNSNVKSYLFTSTKNRCISHLRSRACDEGYHKKNDAKLSILALEHSTLNYIEFNELKEQIGRILNSLPEDMCAIFLMNRNDGKSYIEIADELNISVKTVEKKMSNTIKIFRKNLSDYDFILFMTYF